MSKIERINSPEKKKETGRTKLDRRAGCSCVKIVGCKMLTNIGNVLRAGAHRTVSRHFLKLHHKMIVKRYSTLSFTNLYWFG